MLPRQGNALVTRISIGYHFQKVLSVNFSLNIEDRAYRVAPLDSNPVITTKEFPHLGKQQIIFRMPLKVILVRDNQPFDLKERLILRVGDYICNILGFDQINPESSFALGSTDNSSSFLKGSGEGFKNSVGKAVGVMFYGINILDEILIPFSQK